jgi:RHS repeat-associated protein
MKDNEMKGIGNSYDYGFRMYDSRIGRPFTPDPLFRKFPMLSTYQFFSNNPIKNVDLDGLEGATYEVLMWKNSSGATQINVQNDRLVGQMGYGNTGLYVNVKDEVNNISGSYYVNDVMVTAKRPDNRHMGDKVGSWVQSSSWFGKAINAADKRLYVPSDQFSKWDKFEGPEGFKNHGWPTMKITTGVLATTISAGAYGTFFGTAAMGTGSAIGGGIGLGLNAYNTASDVTQYATGEGLPGNNATGLGGAALDARELIREANPVGGIGLTMTIVDKYLDQKKEQPAPSQPSTQTPPTQQ